MYPTLDVGDYIIVSKLGYGNYDLFGLDITNTRMIRHVERGDVMVFEYPRQPELDFIKRVVGIPGDQILMQGHSLRVNGVEVTRETESTKENISILREHLDTSSYQIALNIDRSHSNEEFNLTVPADAYFVLGDNRNNSNDSRYWGFVPAENMIGKLVYKLSGTP